MTSLGGRYTTLRARDGKEYLIPNETLIKGEGREGGKRGGGGGRGGREGKGEGGRKEEGDEPGGQLVLYQPVCPSRLAFGVAYGTDLRLVRRLAIEAAKETKRVQSSPEPVCHVTEFADNAINLLLRFWISDPSNGVVNIKGDLFLALWDRFVAHGIELPFPQRDLRIRDLPPEILNILRPREKQSDERRSAAD